MNIEQLAREAGFERSTYGLHSVAGMYAYNTQIMERFAALVRNEVLEEAAVKCQERHVNGNYKNDTRDECSDAIRSMKDVKKTLDKVPSLGVQY